MSLISTRLIHPGAIVHVDRFPYFDSNETKSRYALVIAESRKQVIVRGIYSQDFLGGRAAIEATSETGLHHDSYVDFRLVEIPVHRINGYAGEASYDFDPYGDFGPA